AAGTLARRLDAPAHRLRALTGNTVELPRAGARDGDEQVEPVEQRARELVAIGREPRGRAGALRGRVAAGAAWAEIHRRDELEARREDDLAPNPCNRDRPVFERLPQRLERVARELGQLV